MSHEPFDLDFGNGEGIVLRYCECNDPTCDHVTPCGVLWYHNTPSGEPCASAGGYVPLRGPGGWTLQSVDPLTFSPSVLCMRCQRHGFISGGKWVGA